MVQNTPTIVGPEVCARLDQLHALYGRDQPLAPILDGLNMRLDDVIAWRMRFNRPVELQSDGE